MQNTLKNVWFLTFVALGFVSLAWAVEGKLWGFDGMIISILGLAAIEVPWKKFLTGVVRTYRKVRGPRYEQWEHTDSNGRKITMITRRD